jgi:hypothetical protein
MGEGFRIERNDAYSRENFENAAEDSLSPEDMKRLEEFRALRLDGSQCNFPKARALLAESSMPRTVFEKLCDQLRYIMLARAKNNTKSLNTLLQIQKKVSLSGHNKKQVFLTARLIFDQND